MNWNICTLAHFSQFVQLIIYKISKINTEHLFPVFKSSSPEYIQCFPYFKMTMEKVCWPKLMTQRRDIQYKKTELNMNLNERKVQMCLVGQVPPNVFIKKTNQHFISFSSIPQRLQAFTSKTKKRKKKWFSFSRRVTRCDSLASKTSLKMASL